MKQKILTLILAFIFVALTSSVSAFNISGQVTDDDTGLPVNATITVFDTAGNPVNSTNTTGNAVYSLDVSLGLRIFNATAPGYFTRSRPLFVSANKTNFNFELEPATAKVTLYGYVKNSTGNALQGASVQIMIGGAPYAGGTTDINGFYNLTVIDNTDYNVEVSLAGYNVATQAVTVNGSTELNFTLGKSVLTGTIDGYVRNSTGSFVNGATIEVVQGSVLKAMATTNALGYYSVEVKEGTYNLTASEPGYNQAFRNNVQVVNGATIEVNFTLTPAGSSCSQSVSYGSWSSCVSGQQTRTITYTNYLNICGNTYVTTQTQSCTTGGGGSTSSRTTGGGITSILGEALEKLDSDRCSEQSRRFYLMDYTELDFKGTTYRIRLNAIHQNSVDMIIYPVPSIKATISEEGNVTVDLNKDGKDDLEMTLVELDAVKAKIDLKLICEKEPEEEEEGPVEKVKEALINVLGEIKPKSAASVALGSVISLSIVAAGLLIYFLIRKYKH